MLFCTDGITEAMNADEESFGLERLSELCRGQAGIPARELLGEIFSAVGDFAHGCQQHDDMAAAVFHYAG